MIDQRQRRALSELRRLDWAPTPEDVWTALDIHLDGLNGEAGAALLRAFENADGSTGGSPVGLVIEGQHGAGKTHLLRWARERVQKRGGYFFLMGIAEGRSFWTSTVHTFLRGLRRSGSYRYSQLSILLDRLGDRAGVPIAVRHAVRGEGLLTPEVLDTFVAAVRAKDPDLGQECRRVIRALVLLASSDDTISDLGEAWLLSLPDIEREELRPWGLPGRVDEPAEVGAGISRLLAWTGPTMLAVDQIDPIFAHVRSETGAAADSGASPELVTLAEDIGYGLMDLREKLRRTVIVVACLPSSWGLINEYAPPSVPGRFRHETRLSRLPSKEIAKQLIEVRFAPLFGTAEFSPPYPTWPIPDHAFDVAGSLTPRQLMERADDFVRRCLARGEILSDIDLTKPPQAYAEPRQPVSGERLARFDARFAELRDAAQVDGALAAKTEDREMSRLLEAGLQAWKVEQGDRQARYRVLPGGEGNPSVHSWLRETLNEETEDQTIWSFRALSHTNARAVQARVARLVGFAGLNPSVDRRRAYLIRNEAWPRGPVSQRVRQQFLDLGGVITKIREEDLRTFAALAELLSEDDPELPDFLLARRPAGRTALFRMVFGPPPGGDVSHPDPPSPSGGPARVSTGSSPSAAPSVPRQETPVDHIPDLLLGTEEQTGASVRVPLESLRKHAVIFAGSGSGKTVLIRRLVEECALHGVSVIALDPNNDLARLGDPWPDPPDTWREGDPARARDYLANTDVVIWTPRRGAGRPLSLQPLPDFAAVRDEPDEFALALDAGVAALAPRARMAANTAKADRGRAVLRQALDYFGHRTDHGTLSDFVDLMSDLPDDVTSLGKAGELAADMAETLRAAMVNDPLFGGDGTPLDPGVLLTPPPGKRARVSVISLIGLPTDEMRQSFVNQLQMALFAWIKQHPAGDRPLGGLFVMDEAQTFAPSGVVTACTESTLALASQARKYGLGLMFATQAPKGIHNRIVGNAATQFFGFLNSPTQIAAAREVASAKGSAVLDISRLRSGQFYAVTEGAPFRKVSTAMCLSYHPRSALTAEEVLVRAKAEAGAV